jgi:hypothetical protein
MVVLVVKISSNATHVFTNGFRGAVEVKKIMQKLIGNG